MRKILALCTSALLGLGLAVGGATTASADSHFTDNEGQVCAALDSGKIDTTGDPETVTATAPDGMLIDGYCVKAGSDESGDGPVWVDVIPPQKTVTIDHPTKDSVSHYSLSYVDAPDEVTNPKGEAWVKCEKEGIAVHLSNIGEGVNTAVDFTVYVDDVEFETLSLDAGEDEWLKIGDLTEDATYHVVIKADGETIFDEELVFDCEVEDVTNPKTKVWLDCEKGAILVYLSNKGEGVNHGVKFEVQVGDMSKEVWLEAGEDKVLKFDGLTEDAKYWVIVKADGEKIFKDKFIFDCEVEEVTNPEGKAWVKCDKDGISVYLSNKGEGVNTAVEFMVYLNDGHFKTVVLEAGEEKWLKIGDLNEDAKYSVTIKADGEKIFYEKFVYDCEPELPTLPWTGADAGSSGMLAGGLLLLGLTGLYLQRRTRPLVDAE